MRVISISLVMSIGIRIQYRGYLKIIKKDAADPFEAFVKKVRTAAKKPQELPAELIFQYLDEDDELIDVKNDEDLKDCLELVQKPKFCIKDYSTLSPTNTSSIISNVQTSSSKYDSKIESAILTAEITSSLEKKESSRVDEGGELPGKNEEISTR